MDNKPAKFSFKKRIRSFGYAFNGIKEVLSREHNAWIHLFATACVLVAAFLFELEAWEWCTIILAIAAVLMAETFNSSIEKLVDFVSPEHHPEAGKVKDIAAGAVLFMAMGAAVVGLIIFLPKILNLL